MSELTLVRAGAALEQPDPDAALLERLRSGDEAAFLELVRSYGPVMHRLAMSYVRTRGAADMLRPFSALGEGLRRTDTAAREWVGLVAYRLTGRTAELFPGP